MNEELLNNLQVRINNIKHSLVYLTGDLTRLSMMVFEIRTGFEGNIMELDKKISENMK